MLTVKVNKSTTIYDALACITNFPVLLWAGRPVLFGSRKSYSSFESRKYYATGEEARAAKSGRRKRCLSVIGSVFVNELSANSQLVWDQVLQG